jgi:hypothetical protein
MRKAGVYLAKRGMAYAAARRQDQESLRQAAYDAQNHPDPAVREYAQKIAAGNGSEKPPSQQHNRGKRVGAAVLGAAVGAAAVGGAIYLKDQLGKHAEAMQPHQTITREQVQSTLSEVHLRNDTRIMSAKGRASAVLKKEVEICSPFNTNHCATIPKSGQRSPAELRNLGLDLFNNSGGVTLEAGRNRQQPDSQWFVRAIVNTDKLQFELNNRNVKTTTPTERDGLLSRIANLAVNTKVAQRHDDIQKIAKTNFEASCAPILKPDFAAAEANYVKNQLTQTAPVLKDSDPKGYHLLENLANRPIHIRYVDPEPGSQEPITSLPAVSQAALDLSLPDGIKSHEYTTPPHHWTKAHFTLDTSNNSQLNASCTETPQVSKEIHTIEQSHDYILEQ